MLMDRINEQRKRVFLRRVTLHQKVNLYSAIHNFTVYIKDLKILRELKTLLPMPISKKHVLTKELRFIMIKFMKKLSLTVPQKYF